MFDDWNNLIVTKIALASYVAPYTGSVYHENRPFHGIVLNGKGKRADYIFSDGLVLKTYENTLFYLPKNSTYKVITHVHGEGCWAINFDLASEINTKPFSTEIQNAEQLLDNYKKSVDAFCKSDGHSNLTIMKNLYNIILLFKKDIQKKYLPSEKMLLIKPALDIMNTNYAQNNLSVEELAKLCGISVAYFRRLFTEKFGVSPKEYIINRRIDYAKKLLLNEQFTVSEVAEMCGYFEPCHFSREFSKRTGISPVKYKNTQ